MNKLWSENIQGILTLYLSRKLRFDDIFRQKYMEQFRLDDRQPLRILEIGCGPGALAGALHRWYPCAQITALDRDSAFIAFARQHEPGIQFQEGDATALPFADGLFDVTISHTVCEHIAPAAFYSEQKRVLKQGGVCLVLSARRGIHHEADCLQETEAEKRFWERISAGDDTFGKYGVGKYAMTEQELPLSMEAHGFSELSAGYVVAALTPDDSVIGPRLAEKIIDANRQSALETILSTHDEEAPRIAELVNAKFERRLALLRAGVKQWDTDTSITMVLRGVNGAEG